MMSGHMKFSKGLEFPVVALPGVGHMPAKGEDEQAAARVFYVAAMRTCNLWVVLFSDNARRRSLNLLVSFNKRKLTESHRNE